MTHAFETLSHNELDAVAGGLSFSVDFAKGVSISSKLGSVDIGVPNPTALIGKLSKAVETAVTNALELVYVGQLFNFV